MGMIFDSEGGRVASVGSLRPTSQGPDALTRVRADRQTLIDGLREMIVEAPGSVMAARAEALLSEVGATLDGKRRP